jgi:hypothetical protein
MTIGTEPLSPQETWQEINALVSFLDHLGIERVMITYGWGCKAEGIEQPVTIALDELVLLLQESITQGIYHLGEDNLHIESSQESSQPYTKITLCHEGDIHFEAGEADTEARLREQWHNRGHKVWPNAHKRG